MVKFLEEYNCQMIDKMIIKVFVEGMKKNNNKELLVYK
jgi:hypothetical protein